MAAEVLSIWAAFMSSKQLRNLIFNVSVIEVHDKCSSLGNVALTNIYKVSKYVPNN